MRFIILPQQLTLADFPPAPEFIEATSWQPESIQLICPDSVSDLAHQWARQFGVRADVLRVADNCQGSALEFLYAQESLLEGPATIITDARAWLKTAPQVRWTSCDFDTIDVMLGSAYDSDLNDAEAVFSDHDGNLVCLDTRDKAAYHRFGGWMIVADVSFLLEAARDMLRRQRVYELERQILSFAINDALLRGVRVGVVDRQLQRVHARSPISKCLTVQTPQTSAIH